MSTHLFDNTVGPPTLDGGYSGSFELGEGFYVAVDCALSEVRWYAVTTTSGDKPSALRIWNRQTGAQVWSTSTVPHSGSVGWQTTTLSPAQQLYAGGEYVVSMTVGTGVHIGSISTYSLPPSPLGYLNSGKGVQSAFGSAGVMPTSVSGGAWWVDVGVDSSNPPVTGGSAVTNDQLNAKLIAWLASTGDNTHTSDGLPWLTKVVVDAIKTTVDNIPQATDAPWVTVLKTWQIAGALSSVEIAAYNLFAQRAPNQLTGATGGGGSAFFAGDGRQVAQSAATAVDNTDLLLALRRNALATFPGTPWVMADETTWAGPLVYGQEADAYVVHTTTIPPNRPSTLGDGAPWTPRLGWWAVRSGTIFGERHFFDFPSSILGDGSLRMPGVLIWPEDGAAGTIQAWVYS